MIPLTTASSRNDVQGRTHTLTNPIIYIYSLSLIICVVRLVVCKMLEFKFNARFFFIFFVCFRPRGTLLELRCVAEGVYVPAQNE